MINLANSAYKYQIWKYLVNVVNSFAMIVIQDYLRVLVLPVAYFDLLVAGAHQEHIFAFFRTIRYKTMRVSECKDREKSDLCLLLKEKQVEAQACFFSLSQPLSAVFRSSWPRACEVKKNVTGDCVSLKTSGQVKDHVHTLTFFRLSTLRLPCVYLHIPSITCSRITCSP